MLLLNVGVFMRASPPALANRRSCLPLLDALPGETLFSLCSRHHQMWGFRTSDFTCEALFGGRRAGVHHDLPNSLSRFETLTCGAYGSAADLALDLTVLKFYAPFLTPNAIASAVTTMSSPSVNGLKFRLGLLTSRFRAHHPLKACEECMAEDAHDHGWVPWRLAHQFPGVWTCVFHGTPLLECSVKANGVERFMWQLPSRRSLEPRPAPGCASREARGRLTQLIHEVVQSGQSADWLRAGAVQATLRNRMYDRGWITPDGHVRLAPASRDFGAHLAALSDLPDLAGLNVSEQLAYGWIGRMARPPRSGTHPLRKLLLIDWLFESADDFVVTHARASHAELSSASREVHQPCSQQDVAKQSRKAQAIERLQCGSSARSVALAFGIDVGTMMAWGAEAGIVSSRRPKSLVPHVREALLKDLRSGHSKNEAALRHGVSIQTITRLLRTEPGLRSAWQHAVFGTVQRTHRDSWLDAVANHPGISNKQLRAINPAGFAWLYRHDREWLSRHSPQRAARTARRSPVRWDERDIEMSAAVRRIALQLQSYDRMNPPKLWQIVQQLPQLRAKMSVLHLLPLTTQALEEALGRPMRQRASELPG